MRSRTVVAVLFILSISFLGTLRVGPQGPEIGRKTYSPGQIARSLEVTYAQMAGVFEANQGQAEERVKFVARGPEYVLLLTPTEAILVFADQKSSNGPESTRLVRMRIAEAPHLALEGVDLLSGRSHYLIGNDPTKWRTPVAQYRSVRYAGLYPGIDLIYTVRSARIEFDYVLAPYADPRRIWLEFPDAESLAVDRAGALIVRVSGSLLRLPPPGIYQDFTGKPQQIAGRYHLKGNGKVGFLVGAYDPSKTLVIDPVILYATFLGGTNTNRGLGIAVDAAGNMYVVGETFSADFPTMNAIQKTFGQGTTDVFLVKLNPSGSELIFSTYLGGRGGDNASGIAVDAQGNVYLAGGTSSPNFPTTGNAFRSSHVGASDAFVAKISPAGSSLIYSTYLGGTNTDSGAGIAIDSAGSAYVTGSTSSTNFPLVNPLQRDYGGGIDDVFLAKLDTTGSRLVYSTYLGGSAYDAGNAIAVDSSGNVCVTGFTYSTNFPVNRSAQPGRGGGATDAFVAKVNPAGSSIIYATYLGGSGNDDGLGIVADASGDCYVTGVTASTNFPRVRPIQSAHGGSDDAFVTKYGPTGSVQYSTYLGGSARDRGNGIAVDSVGNVYVTGETTSPNFPVANPVQSFGGSFDVFLAKISESGSSLMYSTFLGGSRWDRGLALAVDSRGNAFITGDTISENFPTQKPLQPTFGGTFDAFVLKIGEAP